MILKVMHNKVGRIYLKIKMKLYIFKILFQNELKYDKFRRILLDL
jgi:hypothetical protein